MNTTQPATISPDGRWRWDGTNWVPNVDPAEVARQRRITWITLGACLAGVAVVSALMWPSFAKDTVVTYEVVGTAKGADITYETPSGTSQQSSRSIPLTSTSTGQAGMSIPGFSRGDFVYISAQRQGDVGGGPDVTCRIVVNGKVVSQNTAQGGYSIATCQGRVP